MNDKITLVLVLTKREVEILRNSTSDLGLTNLECVSLQLKIASAIIDSEYDQKDEE